MMSRSDIEKRLSLAEKRFMEKQFVEAIQNLTDDELLMLINGEYDYNLDQMTGLRLELMVLLKGLLDDDICWNRMSDQELELLANKRTPQKIFNQILAKHRKRRM